jgi:uncharacterized membrane protein
MRPRVHLAALAGLATALMPPYDLSANIRTAVAADVAAVVYLALAFRMMAACDRERIRQRAARQDDGAIVILVLILAAIALGFWTIFGVLGEAKQAGGTVKALLIALAAANILLSWLVTQVVFTFHYAHEFYRPEGAHALARGMIFPEDAHPDYWDFFYFATSLGAASQTSDVSIRSKPLRRLVTLHAIISFFFNAAVLALAINIGASVI